MAIRETITGFEIINELDEVVAKVPSFEEAVEINSTVKQKEWSEPVLPKKSKLSSRNTCKAICSKRPWESTALAVNRHQVKEFNEAARAAKTGAWYDEKTGKMCADSDQARNRELARRGYGDADAGYGQRAPGG